MPGESQTSTQQQIEQRMAELPQDVRDAVLSAELGEHLRAIGQKHTLHIDQIGALEDEAMLVMLGFFPPENFTNQIATQLNIPAADAVAIAEEVNQQVFLPIRESMKTFAESKRQVKPAQNPSIGSGEPREVFVPASAASPAAENTVAITRETVPMVMSEPAPASPVSVAAPEVKTPPPSMPEAEKMLTQTTVAKPIYKADPYREPIEP